MQAQLSSEILRGTFPLSDVPPVHTLRPSTEPPQS